MSCGVASQWLLERRGGQLAAEYGFTDPDGTRPDVWRYSRDVESGKHVNPSDYR